MCKCINCVINECETNKEIEFDIDSVISDMEELDFPLTLLNWLLLNSIPRSGPDNKIDLGAKLISNFG